ncbi:hypothetical protein [Desulfocurvibacter africanus]
MAEKVLLVDDEQDFLEALSEHAPARNGGQRGDIRRGSLGQG